MRRGILAAAAAVTLAASGAALAGQPPAHRRRDTVARLDWRTLDNDESGAISRDEWLASVAIFDRLDANHDGVLTRDEVQHAVQERRRERAESRWKELDKDGNGVISRDEWPRGPEVFDRLDADHDGTLTREELHTGARNRMRERATQRWNHLDKDGNGVISREEWPRQPEAFDRLDTNHDGTLTADELASRRPWRIR